MPALEDLRNYQIQELIFNFIVNNLVLSVY